MPSGSLAHTDQIQIEDFLKQLHTGDDSYVYLLRGVAPKEGRQALEFAEGRADPFGGRIRGRESYGIKDASAVPAFVLNDQLPGFLDSSAKTRQKIYLDASFYANEGASLEEANSRGIPWSVGAKRSYSSSARGSLIIYRVKKQTPLRKRPESRVSVPERVVDIPPDAEVVTVLPVPPDISDETGLPEYAPEDP